MRVLVLGGYGLIGLEIVRRLRGDDFDVVGLGRSVEIGKRSAPTIAWIGADIALLARPEDWAAHLHTIDAVVNASGALQDGAKDNLSAVQSKAIRALISACERAGVQRFIQISAPGAEEGARTRFLQTKAEADAALRASSLAYIIFKPGLVISANAYGGTSLLRQLAAFPLVQPIMLGDRLIQTVSATDVAGAVAHALKAPELARRDFDLTEPRAHRLVDLVLRLRAWLGFAPPRAIVSAPLWLGYAMARIADLFGWLGWRSPLRTTALKSLESDLVGDGLAWTNQTGQQLASFEQTLAVLPATAQERLYARAQLAYPVLLGVLAGFWIVSGSIAIAQLDQAAANLSATPLPAGAQGFVFAGALTDIAIGAALLVRRFTRFAAWASIAVCLVYLVLATAFMPFLWADPLGSLVKVLPAMALALAVAALTQER